MGLPNFIVIGAGKSGTTTLYEFLAQHPQVHMSAIKETNYFALTEADKVAAENDPEQQFNFGESVWDWQSYQALFNPSEAKKALGEVSPKYLYTALAADRIKAEIPEVKLIAILRHPAERLHSRHTHLVRENRHVGQDIAEAVQRDSIWWRRNDLVPEGFYYKHLSYYYQLFKKEQIKVYLFEDLQQNQDQLLQDLFGFIGVDANFKPKSEVRYNVSGKVKNPIVDGLIGQKSVLKRVVGSISPQLINTLKKSRWMRDKLEQARAKNLEKIPLSKESKQLVINQIYKEDIEQLQTLIGKDLSHWLK